MTLKRRIRSWLKPLATLLQDVGVNPRRMVALRRFPRYLAQSARFKSLGGAIDSRYIVLTDYDAQAGSASGGYFHQDLLVAQFIHQRNPQTHIDIGSRIDGFVAHVAAFRKITVMDVRHLDDSGHPNISFLQADLMDEANSPAAIPDSISCLHAIEHFGLGRYGDPLDPQGHLRGFHNILRMLKPGGTLYISFPIGGTNQVCFNAHRIFHPRDILQWPVNPQALRLERFDYVDDAGNLHPHATVDDPPAELRYGCGIYTFTKLS